MAAADCLLCLGERAPTLRFDCGCTRGTPMHLTCCLQMMAKTGNRCPTCRRLFKTVRCGGEVRVQVGPDDLCNLATASARLERQVAVRVWAMLAQSVRRPEGERVTPAPLPAALPALVSALLGAFMAVACWAAAMTALRLAVALPRALSAAWQ